MVLDGCLGTAWAREESLAQGLEQSQGMLMWGPQEGTSFNRSIESRDFVCLFV